jgi:hypothetical protein
MDENAAACADTQKCVSVPMLLSLVDSAVDICEFRDSTPHAPTSPFKAYPKSTSCSSISYQTRARETGLVTKDHIFLSG